MRKETLANLSKWPDELVRLEAGDGAGVEPRDAGQHAVRGARYQGRRRRRVVPGDGLAAGEAGEDRAAAGAQASEGRLSGRPAEEAVRALRAVEGGGGGRPGSARRARASAREVEPAGLDWITALRAPEVKKLAATEAKLEQVAEAVRRERRPLRGEARIAVRADRAALAQGRQALSRARDRRFVLACARRGRHRPRGGARRPLRVAHQRGEAGPERRRTPCAPSSACAGSNARSAAPRPSTPRCGPSTASAHCSPTWPPSPRNRVQPARAAPAHVFTQSTPVQERAFAPPRRQALTPPA